MTKLKARAITLVYVDEDDFWGWYCLRCPARQERFNSEKVAKANALVHEKEEHR
jgi:hypothetical protein